MVDPDTDRYGIKGSNNEPPGPNKMALLDAHSHDKDNGGITGTIEVTAVFVYARPPRLGPYSVQNQKRCNRAFVAAR